MAQNSEKNRESKAREVGRGKPPVEHQFKPGQSGNPGGRPKKKAVTEAYERIISDPKVAQAIAQGIIRAARKGNVRAAAEIADRVEGKVSQDVNLNLVDDRKIAEEARKRVEEGEDAN